jgi:hypothetical protein
MNNPVNTASPAEPGMETSADSVRQKKVWRNLFYLNLALTLLLVALFWIPNKVTQLDGFFSEPSIDMPKKGVAQKPEEFSTPAVSPMMLQNMVPAQVTMINASSEKDWAYFDFSRAQQVHIADRSSLEWDLAFRRGKIISNGGVTNKLGGSGLIDLGDVDFDQVTEAPNANYITDQATRSDPENPVLLKWYSYNYLSHKLTPKKNVYVVKTADNKYAKIQFLNFYCANKEAGCIQMRFAYQENGSNSFLKEAPTAETPEKPGP